MKRAVFGPPFSLYKVRVTPTALTYVVFALLAQAVPASFDAVSIKPVQGRPAGAVSKSPNRFVDPGATLLSLVRYAYSTSTLRVGGGEEWTRTARYSVNAVAAGTPTDAEMRVMVSEMLRDRFGLRMRMERREMAVFVLSLRSANQLGPQLRRSDADCGLFFRGDGPPFNPPRDRSGALLCMNGASGNGQVITLRLRGAPLTSLAGVLESRLQRPLVDDTGLSGAFDIDLATGRVNSAADAADAPGLVAALEEQLGLRLRGDRRTIDVWVIDDAHPPTPD